MARIEAAGRAAVTYILFAGLQRSFNLMILPFVTHAMSPVEYGAASMLSAASMLITAIIAAPLIQLIIRAAARGERNGTALLRAVGAYCYVALPVSMAPVAALVALFVPEFLGVPGHIWGIELLAIAFQPANMTFAMWVSQAREDLSRFVWLSSTSVLAAGLSKLFLVVVVQLGVLGWAISDFLSAFISALMAYSLVRPPRARVTKDHIVYALKFTVPLIPHTASLWALTSLSRPAMAAVSSLQQVGLLSFGLNLATVASLLLAETNRAVLPRYSREKFPAPSYETFVPVKWQLLNAFAAPALIGCGVAVAGHWMFAQSYWPSFFLTGILLVGQVAYGLYLIPMNYLTQTAGLPKFSALASGAGAVIILISILVFGRTYGAVGVAYATVAGYMTMAAVALGLTIAHRLEIRWRAWLSSLPIVLVAVAALGCSTTALAFPVGSSLSMTSASFSIVLLSAAAVLALRRRPIRPV